MGFFTKKLEEQEKADFQLLYANIQNEELRNRIRTTGNWYIERAIRCKAQFFILSIAGISFPLFATGANALGDASSGYIRIVTIVCTLMASFSTSLLAFTDCGGNWKMYRKTIENIKRELSSYWAHKSEDESLKGLMERIEKYMKEENQNWIEDMQMQLENNTDKIFAENKNDSSIDQK